MVWIPFKVAKDVLEVSDRTLRRRLDERDNTGERVIKIRRKNRAGHIEVELHSLLNYKIKKSA